ncbi:Uma2 family endonuclease [Streptomyces sp. DG2A-72]|uniref:Uma2 family endonuclease n=1 Tax=Streptomyces sp. DG2A-72 TaxID=3051386 RepID=UPI00265C8C1C|nr:Uma2 family endonuclease [Streptomyces sp. DG2A-72]MDO0935284.1 Uma2 family endonuclease [Streptomyces sp. DG2A-72]
MAAEAHTEQHPRATPENWMCPPEEGWTWDQVKELDVPFDWELVDGKIVVRGAPKWWHDRVRNRLYMALELAKRPPYGAEAERPIQLDEHNVPRPDVIVYDKTEIDVRTMECTPVASVVLAVEVVSPGSRREDRFLKPAMYAEAGIAHYWRVERGENDIPVVHQLWIETDSGMMVPRPDRPVHTDKLSTIVPFPVEIDLRSLIED